MTEYDCENCGAPDATKPRCDRPTECRIMLLSSATTLAHYPSITDGFGNELNPDRNETRQSFRCLTCGSEWITSANRQN